MSNMIPTNGLTEYQGVGFQRSTLEPVYYSEEPGFDGGALSLYTNRRGYSVGVPEVQSINLGTIGDFARSIADARLTFANRKATPRGMLGGATPQSKWAAGLNYVTENWLCPSLDEIRAYDHMVSIYGYNQAGRAIDLSNDQSRNLYMPRVNFTYVKTNNAHINGDLGIYRRAIEQAFDRGIRFWNPKFKGALGTYPEGVIENNKLR